nr:hypothetical protein FFPRI1PSEUD_27930 [Pseudomonas sp. FFPRI_1]
MVIVLILSGLALRVAMQFAIVCVALKHSLGNASLSLFISFLVYACARKDSQARPFLWGWYLGIGLLVAGGQASA